MIRCYITDRLGAAFTSGQLLDCIHRQAQAGVELIQIREKDLGSRDLFALAAAAVTAVKGTRTKILVNSRADIALAAGAGGIHLPEGSIAPAVWRTVLPPGFLITAACHSVEAVRRAKGADFGLVSPVYASPGKGSPIGLAGLTEMISAASFPILALGGVTWETASLCLQAGAAGIAGIRLFQFEPAYTPSEL